MHALTVLVSFVNLAFLVLVSALTLSVGRQEGHLAFKNYGWMVGP